MITIFPTHLTDIQAEGIAAYPEECCGAMLGLLDPKTGEKQVQKLIPLDNQWEETPGETKARRFAVSPQAYQWVEKKAKEEQLQVLGFYHSHPDHPAFPSDTDLAYAWPLFSYIIISIPKASPGDIHSFELDLNSGKFKQEKLIIK